MATTATLTEEGTGKTIQAGGVKLHYQEAGTGEPILFLHAYGPGTTAWVQWQRNVEALSQHFRCIMLDLPNSGRSERLAPLPDEPGHHTMARGALLLLDALGIEKAHLVGNSMGGTTCLVIAIDHPERVNRVVAGGLPRLHRRRPLPDRQPAFGGKPGNGCGNRRSHPGEYPPLP